MIRCISALGVLAMASLLGCAATSTHPASYDVLIAKDSAGQRLVVMPAAGILMRDGSREDVQMKLSSAGDLATGRLKVLSADGKRVLVDLSLSDVEVEHRFAGGLASAYEVPARPEQLAALIDH